MTMGPGGFPPFGGFYTIGSPVMSPHPSLGRLYYFD